MPQLGRVGRSRHADGRGLLVADEIGQGDLERAGEPEERADARVGLALLDLDDQAAADPAPRRQVIQRPRTRGAKATHSLRERPRDTPVTLLMLSTILHRWCMKTIAPETGQWLRAAAFARGRALNVPPVLASNFAHGGDRVYTRDDGTRPGRRSRRYSAVLSTALPSRSPPAWLPPRRSSTCSRRRRDRDPG
jgi:hypothetical protein